MMGFRVFGIHMNWNNLAVMVDMVIDVAIDWYKWLKDGLCLAMFPWTANRYHYCTETVFLLCQLNRIVGIGPKVRSIFSLNGMVWYVSCFL